MVATFVGSAIGLKDAKGASASFSHPWGMCLNPHDNFLYVCDHSNKAIRKVTMQGIW
jgi:hypothetical protein